MPHKIPSEPWEVVGADIFTLNNENYLCIADYHNKLAIIKKSEDLFADNLIVACEIIFPEYGLPRKIMSGAGGNFISEKFFKTVNMKCEPSSS